MGTEFQDIRDEISAMKTWNRIPIVGGVTHQVSHARTQSEPSPQQHKFNRLMEENQSLKIQVETLQETLRTFESQIDTIQCEKRELSREKSNAEQERDKYHQQSWQLQCDLKRTKGTLRQRESKLMQMEMDQIDENGVTLYGFCHKRRSLIQPMHSRTMFIESSLCLDDNSFTARTENDSLDVTPCPSLSYRGHGIQQSSTAFEFDVACYDTASDCDSFPRSCTRY